MPQYTYIHPADFPSGLNLVQLQAEITASVGVAHDPNFINWDYGTNDVIVDFTATLTGGQETALDGVIAAHVALEVDSNIQDIQSIMLSLEGTVMYVGDGDILLTP